MHPPHPTCVRHNKHETIANFANLDGVTELQLPVSTGGDSLDFQEFLIQINSYCLATGHDGDPLLSKTQGSNTQDYRPVTKVKQGKCELVESCTLKRNSRKTHMVSVDRKARLRTQWHGGPKGLPSHWPGTTLDRGVLRQTLGRRRETLTNCWQNLSSLSNLGSSIPLTMLVCTAETSWGGVRRRFLNSLTCVTLHVSFAARLSGELVPAHLSNCLQRVPGGKSSFWSPAVQVRNHTGFTFRMVQSQLGLHSRWQLYARALPVILQ